MGLQERGFGDRSYRGKTRQGQREKVALYKLKGEASQGAYPAYASSVDL